jgi:Tfp pilus assembly protein PilF
MATTLAVVIAILATLTYHRQDAFRDAFAYWTDATRDARFGPIAHVNLGQLHEGAGRPQEARREYLRALERDANTPKAHNNLGVVLMTLGEPDLALAHFREETTRHPWNADGWFNLGLWMETRGQAAAARPYYERALEANPSYAPAYDKLGRQPPD